MKKPIIIIASIVAVVLLIGGALYVRGQAEPAKSNVKPAATQTFTAQQLAAYDGKDGHKCYVAVEGKVYEIEQGRYWKDGQHTTSQGQAECGKDLTQAIGKSPHGKSKLTTLTVVGTYQN